MSSSTALWREWFDLRLPRLSKTLHRVEYFIIVLFGIGAYREPSAPPPPALIARTQEVFGRRLKRDVNADEAREIIRSFANFVSLIKEVRRGQK